MLNGGLGLTYKGSRRTAKFKCNYTNKGVRTYPRTILVRVLRFNPLYIIYIPYRHDGSVVVVVVS